MGDYLTLSELFHRQVRTSPELPDAQVRNTIVTALDSAATKLERIKALILVAPQPLTTGLQKRLFDVLASEDFRLAADIIIYGAATGADAAHYLLGHIADFDSLEQLRQVVGLLAASAQYDLDPELLAEGNFAALRTYAGVIAGMNRLLAQDHAIDEVRDLARNIIVAIVETESRLDCIRPEPLTTLLAELDNLSQPYPPAPVRPREERAQRSEHPKPADGS
jgi:hypothetical protein